MSKRFLFDSNAVSDWIYERGKVLERSNAAKKNGGVIGTCPPVTGELFQGAEGSQSRERSLDEIRRALWAFRIWPYGLVESQTFGHISAYLKRTGRPMQTVDMQLAAVALTLGDCTVVSTDSDLRAVPGLTVEDWTAG